MRTVQTWIIVNPKAGSGRARRAGASLKKRLPGASVVETQQKGEAQKLARRARREGVDLIVSVGGDGTIQECVSGLCLTEDGIPTKGKTRLAVLPAGTGGDYRKTFTWGDSIDQAVTRIEVPHPRPVDIGLVRYHATGEDRVSCFANVLSFGLGGLTDQLVDKSPKWLGGRVAFFLGAVRATTVHQPVPIELLLDGKLVETAPFSNVAVCLGKFFGGGMQIAPDADPSDGLLDIVTMEMSRLQTLSLAADIYRGTHFKRAGVKSYRAKKLEARVTRVGEALIDVDGEQLGSLPLSVEVLPRALDLLV